MAKNSRDLTCPFCGTKRIGPPDEIEIKVDGIITVLNGLICFTCEDCDKKFMIEGHLVKDK